MADKMPNYEMEKQRIRMTIAKLRATIERQRFENLEMQERMDRNVENISVTGDAIMNAEQALAELEKEHGP